MIFKITEACCRKKKLLKSNNAISIMLKKQTKLCEINIKESFLTNLNENQKLSRHQEKNCYV